MSTVQEWFTNRDNQILAAGSIVFLLLFGGYFGWLANNQTVLTSDELSTGGTVGDWIATFETDTMTQTDTQFIDDGQTFQFEYEIQPQDGYAIASIEATLSFGETDEPLAFGLCDSVDGDLSGALTGQWNATHSTTSGQSSDCNGNNQIQMVLTYVPGFTGENVTYENTNRKDIDPLYTNLSQGLGIAFSNATVNVQTAPQGLLTESGEEVSITWRVTTFTYELKKSIDTSVPEE